MTTSLFRRPLKPCFRAWFLCWIIPAWSLLGADLLVEPINTPADPSNPPFDSAAVLVPSGAKNITVIFQAEQAMTQEGTAAANNPAPRTGTVFNSVIRKIDELGQVLAEINLGETFTDGSGAPLNILVYDVEVAVDPETGVYAVYLAGQTPPVSDTVADPAEGIAGVLQQKMAFAKLDLDLNPQWVSLFMGKHLADSQEQKATDGTKGKVIKVSPDGTLLAGGQHTGFGMNYEHVKYDGTGNPTVLNANAANAGIDSASAGTPIDLTQVAAGGTRFTGLTDLSNLAPAVAEAKLVFDLVDSNGGISELSLEISGQVAGQTTTVSTAFARGINGTLARQLITAELFDSVDEIMITSISGASGGDSLAVRWQGPQIGSMQLTRPPADGLADLESAAAEAPGPVSGGGAPIGPFSSSPGLAIPDNAPAVTDTQTLPDAGALYNPMIAVDIDHTWIGDLILTVTSPSGASVTLHNRSGGGSSDIKGTYGDDLTSSGNLSLLSGQPTAGVWRLSVRDAADNDTGTLNSWSVAGSSGLKKVRIELDDPNGSITGATEVDVTGKGSNGSTKTERVSIASPAVSGVTPGEFSSVTEVKLVALDGNGFGDQMKVYWEIGAAATTIPGTGPNRLENATGRPSRLTNIEQPDTSRYLKLKRIDSNASITGLSLSILGVRADNSQYRNNLNLTAAQITALGGEFRLEEALREISSLVVTGAPGAGSGDRIEVTWEDDLPVSHPRFTRPKEGGANISAEVLDFWRIHNPVLHAFLADQQKIAEIEAADEAGVLQPPEALRKLDVQNNPVVSDGYGSAKFTLLRLNRDGTFSVEKREVDSNSGAVTQRLNGKQLFWKHANNPWTGTVNFLTLFNNQWDFGTYTDCELEDLDFDASGERIYFCGAMPHANEITNTQIFSFNWGFWFISKVFSFTRTFSVTEQLQVEASFLKHGGTPRVTVGAVDNQVGDFDITKAFMYGQTGGIVLSTTDSMGFAMAISDDFGTTTTGIIFPPAPTIPKLEGFFRDSVNDHEFTAALRTFGFFLFRHYPIVIRNPSSFVSIDASTTGVYLAGSYAGYNGFDNVQTNSVDAEVLRLSPTLIVPADGDDGFFRRATVGGPDGLDRIDKMHVDNSGRVYIAGMAAKNLVDFKGSAVNGADPNDITEGDAATKFFFAKLSPELRWEWRHVSVQGSSVVTAEDLDGDGDSGDEDDRAAKREAEFSELVPLSDGSKAFMFAKAERQDFSLTQDDQVFSVLESISVGDPFSSLEDILAFMQVDRTGDLPRNFSITIRGNFGTNGIDADEGVFIRLDALSVNQVEGTEIGPPLEKGRSPSNPDATSFQIVSKSRNGSRVRLRVPEFYYAENDGSFINPDEYVDLRLMSVNSTVDLPGTGRSLVIVAKVGNDLHVRIFDASERMVVDKTESELNAGQELTDLEELRDDLDFPDGLELSSAEEQEIIDDARLATEYFPALLVGGTSAFEDAIRNDAQRRFDGAGFSVVDSVVSGTSNAYTFLVERDTVVQFHWDVNYALTIDSNLSDIGNELNSKASGNPVPDVNKHWILKNELMAPEINGVEGPPDPSKFQTRYAVIGYEATGSARPQDQRTSDTAFVPWNIGETRQKVTGFTMEGPGTITYRWLKQNAIRLSSSTSRAQNLVQVEVVDDVTRTIGGVLQTFHSAGDLHTGSNEFWFAHGANVIVRGLEDTDLGLTPSGFNFATGDLADLDDPSQTEIPFTLDEGTSISFNFGQRIHYGVVLIGRAIDFSSLLGNIYEPREINGNLRVLREKALELGKANLLNRDFAIDLWVKRDAGRLDREEYLISHVDADPGSVGSPEPLKSLHVGFLADKSFVFNFQGHDLSIPFASYSPDLNPTGGESGWNHWAVIYDNDGSGDDTRRVFLNGAQVGTNDTISLDNGYEGDPAVPLFLGFSPQHGEFFQGDLDNVRVWKIADEATVLASVNLGAADGDGIALDQTLAAAGDLALNGNFASPVASLSPPARVTITSAGDDSARTFTVTGTDAGGANQTEVINGANAATATGTDLFGTVTLIAVDDATAGTVSAGFDNGSAAPLIADQQLDIGRTPKQLLLFRNFDSGATFFDSNVIARSAGLAPDAEPNRVTVVDAPSGTNEINATAWDDLADKLYPLRPGTYLIEWKKQSVVDTGEANPEPDDLVYTQIRVEFPIETDYRHVVDTPAVFLDPSESDSVAFKELAYTEGDARVEAESAAFMANQPGRTVLVFFEAPAAAGGIATGNDQVETLLVKTVRSSVLNTDSALKFGLRPTVVLAEDTSTAVIGRRLQAPAHPDSVPAADLFDLGAGDGAAANLVAPMAPTQLEIVVEDLNHSISAFALSVAGTDGNDDAISEVLDFSGGLRQATGKQFKTVTAIDVGALDGHDTGDQLTLIWRDPARGNALGVDGYLYRERARYNTAVHDRASHAGPIFPVNQEFSADPKDDLLTVWYEEVDNIAWPFRPVRYRTRWPLATDADAKRIVIASRLGSEGVDSNGAIQPTLSPPQIDRVTVYSQNNPDEAGYNPNEEHALLAGSLLNAGSPSAAKAVYALRNDLNISDGLARDTVTDGSEHPDFTGQPFALVHYRDLSVTPPEWRMHAYEVVTEDPATIHPSDDPVTMTASLNGGATFLERPGADKTGHGFASIEPVEIGGTVYFVTGTDETGFGLASNVVDAAAGNAADTGVLGAVDLRRLWPYTFNYRMRAGEPVNPPHPLSTVIGPTPCPETFCQDSDPAQRTAFRDHKDQWWTVSGRTGLIGRFYYPLLPHFDVTGKNLGTGSDPIRLSDYVVGTCVPWLLDTPGANYPVNLETGPLEPPSDVPRPRAVAFQVLWPDSLLLPEEERQSVPQLRTGESLTFSGGEAKGDRERNGEVNVAGLPGVLGWSAGQVVYDDLNKIMVPSDVFTQYLIRLINPLEDRLVELKFTDLPARLSPASGNVIVDGSRYFFKELHAGLQTRIYYDTLRQKLVLRGFVNGKTLGDDSLTAAPPSIYSLQPNILTRRERDAAESIGNGDLIWGEAVEKLYLLSIDPEELNRDYTVGLESFPGGGRPKSQLGPGLAVIPNPALTGPTAGFAGGYATLAENNREELGAAPVAIHIVRVVPDKYRGAVEPVFPPNLFDEKITARFTGDFGARPDDIQFQWIYREEDGDRHNPPPPGTPAAGFAALGWNFFPDLTGNNGLGMNEAVFAGAGKITLQDNLVFTRWKNVSEADDAVSWSQWAGAANNFPDQNDYQAQLIDGWVKRVLRGLNPFDARFTDFRNNDAPATYASMIRQAGPRHEGAVAFNPGKDVIENVGLIEVYQTVLDRAADLSINLLTPETGAGVNNAILLAASRVSDLYHLLGNEAYVDALNPTIGYTSASGEYGRFAPSIFAFQNQAPSLLDEELTLLRGHGQEGARPTYNRFIWNFTIGDGEAAYQMNYGIWDVNNDGFIDEADGRAMFPMGHGDAWGHYTSALKSWYDLLNHANFTWESRAELFQLEGQVIDVDYLDERKFARVAADRARAGSEIVTQTYRNEYVSNPDGQWQGYKDTDPNRGWGVTEWAGRAGQGALFDWVVANALLPEEAPNAPNTTIGIASVMTTDSGQSYEITVTDALAATDGAVTPNRIPYLLRISDGDGLLGESVFAPTYDAVNQGLILDATEIDDGDLVFTVSFPDGAPAPGLTAADFSLARDERPRGIRKVDRTTVVDLAEIASQGLAVQGVLDDANAGLNPLGITPDIVPFDISPANTDADGNYHTHFDHIHERTLTALANAGIAFDYANQFGNLLRENEDSVEELTQTAIDQDIDFRNRLIELFGMPYEGQIGAGKVYPSGYTGPDLILFMYGDLTDISARTIPPPDEGFQTELQGFNLTKVTTIDGTNSVDGNDNSFLLGDGGVLTAFFSGDLAVGSSGTGFATGPGNAERYQSLTQTLANHYAQGEIRFPQSSGDFAFQAPIKWGQRLATGELQDLQMELIQADAALYGAVDNYTGHVALLQDLMRLIEAQYDHDLKVLDADEDFRTTLETLQATIAVSNNISRVLGSGLELAEQTVDAFSDGSGPRFIVAGTSNGTDPSFALKAALKIAGLYATNLAFRIPILAAEASAEVAELRIDVEELGKDISIQREDIDLGLRERLYELAQGYRDENVLRVQILSAQERLRQVAGQYRATLQKGVRILDERRNLNARIAASTTKSRYRDMTFRLARNDALQKYRAAYDHAARNVFTLAKVYDYETNLDPRDPASSQPLLEEIVRARTLGVLSDSEPTLEGGGLSEILFRLKTNYDVLKTQLGINNPQVETGRFSLRRELFRIKADAEGDSVWRRTLEKHKTPDLWLLPEFRRYCRPPQPQGAGPLPGLVIPFESYILAGKNFFGWPLGPGDNGYDPTNFTTKARSAGVWFEGYNETATTLASTPRVYLVPAGNDIMTVPNSNTLKARVWNTVDEKLPVPLPIGSLELNDANWIPMRDSVDGFLGDIRKYSSFRAYPISSGEALDLGEMTTDNRLVGRSVWNTRWLLIIPGIHLLGEADEGLSTFIGGRRVPGDSTGERDGNGISDIEIFFQTFGYSGN